MNSTALHGCNYSHQAKESVIWSDHIWVQRLKSQRGLYTNSPDPKREEENSHCFRMCGSMLSCFFCIFLQYLYMLSCCSWPRPLCIKRVSEIGTFIGERWCHQGHKSQKASSFHSEISERKHAPLSQLSTTRESPSDRVASLPSSPWRSRPCFRIHGGMIVLERKQKKCCFYWLHADCQTSADILPGPTWNVFDTSPRFITAFAAVRVCVFVLCVCQATARTPVLVGGSEGLL